LENDDRTYTVEDLLPLAEREQMPLVYDVHHHRCNPDGLSIEQATEATIITWRGREPWMHLSSPAQGFDNGDPRPHADYINPDDFPLCWRGRSLTIDVEARAKEKAVLGLQQWLKSTHLAREAV